MTSGPVCFQSSPQRHGRNSNNASRGIYGVDGESTFSLFGGHVPHSSRLIETCQDRGQPGSQWLNKPITQHFSRSSAVSHLNRLAPRVPSAAPECICSLLLLWTECKTSLLGFSLNSCRTHEECFIFICSNQSMTPSTQALSQQAHLCSLLLQWQQRGNSQQ